MMKLFQYPFVFVLGLLTATLASGMRVQSMAQAAGRGAVVAAESFTADAAAEAAAEAGGDVVPAEQEKPLYLTDPAAYRKQAVMQMLCDLFAIKVEPEEGDDFIDLLPKGTTALDVVNPGFEFTYDNGKLPGRDYWIIGVQRDKPGHINGGMSGPSDPIQGWSATGCSGLESGRPKQWKTAPDGCTGYIVAQGLDNTLDQTLTGALQPSTRYTLVLEVFKRNDYKRAEKSEIIIRLTDANGDDIKSDTADYVIEPADLETGFAVCAITLTTTADVKPGDLTVRIGMNAEKNVRFNFDNLRLWAQPLK